MPQYLDDNGEPIYLDEEGNPVKTPKSISGFASNVVTSGGRLIENIGDTVQWANEARQKPFGSWEQQGRELVDVAKGIGQQFKDRYGSLEAAGNTLYEDPFGVAGDVSTVLGGVGGAAKLAQLPKVARIAARASVLTNPLTPVAKAAEAGLMRAKPVLDKLGRKAVQGAMKPPVEIVRDTLAYKRGQGLDAGRQELVNTYLTENMPAVGSPGAAASAGARAEALDAAAKELVNAAPRTKNIDPQRLADALNPAEARVSSQLTPEADVASVRGVRAEIERNPKLTKPKRVQVTEPMDTGLVDEFGKPITRDVTRTETRGRKFRPVSVQRIQNVKEGTNARLRGKNLIERNSAADSALEDAVSETRDIISEKVPETRAMNEQQSRLIALEKALDRAAVRTGNRDITQLGEQVLAAGRNPVRGILGAINRPGIQSSFGKLAYRTGQALPGSLEFEQLLRQALLARMLGQQTP